MAEAFDLAAFDSLVSAQEQGIDVEIKGPNGKKLGADGFAIKVAGPDSERFRSAEAELALERIEAEDISEVTPEQYLDNRIRILAKCTISWTSIVLGGAALECTEENAKTLYARFPFIREQVERKAGRRASFMPGSAGRSAGRSSKGTENSAAESQA